MLTPDLDRGRLRELCERYGVASLELFGSVARGDDDRDSDVDLLYVLRPGMRLGFRLFDLEDELAQVFGKPVDLVARSSIHHQLRAGAGRGAAALCRVSCCSCAPSSTRRSPSAT